MQIPRMKSRSRCRRSSTFRRRGFAQTVHRGYCSMFVCPTVVLSSVRHLPCNNRVRLNRCKYGTEGYFSANSVHGAVFRPLWRNCQSGNAVLWGVGLFGSGITGAFWSQNTDLASSNVSPCLRHTHRLSQIPLGGSSSMWLSNTKYCRNI